MSDFIHIVCLDAPSPPDYGGAIDMYSKIRALSEIGIKIILHYFDYKEQRGIEGLETSCHAIFSYKRKSFFSSFFPLPYIVSSRINKQLIDRLNQDDYPVVLEGIHCTGILPHLKKKDRKIIIRIHNDEAKYYHHLAQSEKNILKKIYFATESMLLKRYQKAIHKEHTLACLSQNDVEVFAKKYSFSDVHFIPCFTPWQNVSGKTGIGEYCLYHGNLSVSENQEAAIWLIENIFTTIDVPLVVAGKYIPENIKQLIKNYTNINFVDNPDNEALDSLIKDAHVHVLPAMNNTGVKLKLLHALFEGRFCITNTAGVSGSKLEDAVTIANIPTEFQTQIKKLMTQSFSESDRERRIQLLEVYDNRKNAEKINALLL